MSATYEQLLTQALGHLMFVVGTDRAEGRQLEDGKRLIRQVVSSLRDEPEKPDPAGQALGFRLEEVKTSDPRLQWLLDNWWFGNALPELSEAFRKCLTQEEVLLTIDLFMRKEVQR